MAEHVITTGQLSSWAQLGSIPRSIMATHKHHPQQTQVWLMTLWGHWYGLSVHKRPPLETLVLHGRPCRQWPSLQVTSWSQGITSWSKVSALILCPLYKVGIPGGSLGGTFVWKKTWWRDPCWPLIEGHWPQASGCSSRSSSKEVFDWCQPEQPTKSTNRNPRPLLPMELYL